MTTLPEKEIQRKKSASSSSSLDSRKIESAANKGAIAKLDVKVETSNSKPKKAEIKQSTKQEKKSLLTAVKEKLDPKRHHKHQTETTNVQKQSAEKPKDAHKSLTAKLHYKSASKENLGGLKFTQQEYEQFHMKTSKDKEKSDTSDDEVKNKQSKKRFRDHFTSKATKEKDVKVKPSVLPNPNEVNKPKPILGSKDTVSSQESFGNYEKIDVSKKVPTISATVTQSSSIAASSKPKKIDSKKSSGNSSNSKDPITKTKHHKREKMEETDSSSEDSSTVAEKIKHFFHRTNEEIKQLSKPSEKPAKKPGMKPETVVVIKPIVESQHQVQKTIKKTSSSESSSSDSEKTVTTKTKIDKPTPKAVPEKQVPLLNTKKAETAKELEPQNNLPEKQRKKSSSSEDESKKEKDRKITVNVRTPQYKIYSNELPIKVTTNPIERRHSSSSSDSSDGRKKLTSKNIIVGKPPAYESKSSDEIFINSGSLRQPSNNYPEFRLVSLQSKEPVVNTGPSKYLFNQKSKSSNDLHAVEKEQQKYFNLKIKKDSDSSDSEKKKRNEIAVPSIPKSRKSSSSSDDEKKVKLQDTISKNTILRKDSTSSDENKKITAKISQLSSQAAPKLPSEDSGHKGNVSIQLTEKIHSDSSSSHDEKKQKEKFSVSLNPRGSKGFIDEQKNNETIVTYLSPKIDKESSSSDDEHKPKKTITNPTISKIDMNSNIYIDKKTNTYTISFPPLPKFRRNSSSSDEEKKKHIHDSSDSDKKKKDVNYQPQYIAPTIHIQKTKIDEKQKSQIINVRRDSTSSDDKKPRKEKVSSPISPKRHTDSNSKDVKKKTPAKIAIDPTTKIDKVSSSPNRDTKIKDPISVGIITKIRRDSSSSEDGIKIKGAVNVTLIQKVGKDSSRSDKEEKHNVTSVSKARKDFTSSSDEERKETIIATSKTKTETSTPVKVENYNVPLVTNLRRSSSSSDEEQKTRKQIPKHPKPTIAVQSNKTLQKESEKNVILKPSVPKPRKSSTSSDDESLVPQVDITTNSKIGNKKDSEKKMKSKDSKSFSILSKLRRESSSSEDEIKNKKSTHTPSTSNNSKVEISADDKKNKHSFSIPSFLKKHKDSTSSDEENDDSKVFKNSTKNGLTPLTTTEQKISVPIIAKSHKDSSSSDEKKKHKEKTSQQRRDSSDSDKCKKSKQPVTEPIIMKVNMSTIGPGSEIISPDTKSSNVVQEKCNVSSESSDDNKSQKQHSHLAAGLNSSKTVDRNGKSKHIMKWKSSEFLDRFRKKSDSSDDEKKKSKKDSSVLVLNSDKSSSKHSDAQKDIEIKKKLEISKPEKSSSSESSDNEEIHEKSSKSIIKKSRKSSQSSDENKKKCGHITKSSSSEESKKLESTFVIVPKIVTPVPMKRTLSSDVLMKNPKTNINIRKSSESSDDTENNVFNERNNKSKLKTHEKPEKYKVHKVTHVLTKKSKTSSSSSSDSSDEEKKIVLETVKPPIPKERKKSHGEKNVPHSTKPSWINESFIEISLRKQFGADIKVTNLHVEPAVGKGENYACDVFRARAYTKTKIVQLLLKCLPETKLRAKLMQESKVSEREILVYNHALPLLRGDLDTPKYPLCYYTYQDGTRDTLVLQDMKPLGYESAPRTKGLDVEHCRLALTELAHLHGLSAAMRKLAPDVFESQLIAKYPEVMYREDRRQTMAPFFGHAISGVSKAILTHLPMRYHFAGHILEDISDDAFDVIKRCVNYKHGYTVFNHGDYWSNNMLFRYAKGSTHPLACSMIDFQMARCVPAVFDLLYFLFTSTEQEVRRAHQKELLKLYMNEAHWIMQLQGVDDPAGAFYVSLEEMEADMRKHAIFGFLSSCLSMPVIVANQDDVPDMEDFKEEDFGTINPFEKMYNSSAFCRRMRQVIEDFDDMGLFEDIVNGKIYK